MGRGVTAALDTSAVLAVVFGELGADRVLPELAGGLISAVNVAEVTAKMVDRGFDWTAARAAVNRFGLAVSPFDGPLAYASGSLRDGARARGLSLGDRACLALAQREGARVLTADRAWAGLGIGVEIEVIR